MQSKRQFRITLTLILLSCMMMGALLLFASGCSVKIADETFCSPIRPNLGAVCDNFLTSNQRILDQAGWETQQDAWAAQGLSTECTNSKTVGDIKREIEKLCSLAPCDYVVKMKLIHSLDKIEKLGR